MSVTDLSQTYTTPILGRALRLVPLKLLQGTLRNPTVLELLLAPKYSKHELATKGIHNYLKSINMLHFMKKMKTIQE